jgi:hypothetical protein
MLSQDFTLPQFGWQTCFKPDDDSGVEECKAALLMKTGWSTAPHRYKNTVAAYNSTLLFFKISLFIRKSGIKNKKLKQNTDLFNQTRTILTLVCYLLISLCPVYPNIFNSFTMLNFIKH